MRSIVLGTVFATLVAQLAPLAAEIRAAGGREGHLRSLEALALWPANSLFVEGYLTTRGDAVSDTYRMIREAGFVVQGNALQPGEGAGAAAGSFHLRGGEGTILKPDIARAER